MNTGLAYRQRVAPSFGAWRVTARQLLRDGIAPDEVELVSEENDTALAFAFAEPPTPTPELGVAQTRRPQKPFWTWLRLLPATRMRIAGSFSIAFFGGCSASARCSRMSLTRI